MQDGFGPVWAVEDGAHPPGLLAVAFEVTVLEHDPGTAGSLGGEADLDLGGARRIGFIAPVGADLPAEENAPWRLEDEDAPPVGLAAVAGGFVPPSADERLEDDTLARGLGEVMRRGRLPSLLLEEQLKGAHQGYVDDDRLRYPEFRFHRLLSFHFGVLLERFERLRPVPVEVVAHRCERAGVNLVEPSCTLGVSGHQPGLTKDAQMHRDRRPPDRDRPRELPHRKAPVCESAEDLALRAVTQRVECEVNIH